MKKLLTAVVILALIGLALWAGKSFAVDATEAINPEAQPMIIYGHSRTSAGVTGIAKISAEPTKVQTSGNAQVYDGSCRVYSVTLYSDTAGDMAGIWDCSPTKADGLRNCNAQWMEFEIGISANTSSNTVNLYGTKFENGVYISVSDGTNSRVGVVYDY